MNCLRPDACMKVPGSSRIGALCRSCARTESALGWCPLEYRDIYHDLANRSDVSHAEAKRLTLEHIAVMERRKARAA